MAIDSSDFRVEAGRHVDLATLPAALKAFYKSHTNYKKQLKKHVKKLSSLQLPHYASDLSRHGRRRPKGGNHRSLMNPGDGRLAMVTFGGRN